MTEKDYSDTARSAQDQAAWEEEQKELQAERESEESRWEDEPEEGQVRDYWNDIASDVEADANALESVYGPEDYGNY